MALDGLVIHSLMNELKDKLLGGKIDKIYQPEDDEIILTIRNNGKNHKLLISSSASNPRIYIANEYKKENPINAPMFCMLLRKYFSSGKIVDISQLDFERVIKISVESLDELKTKTVKNIIIEIMGRHSNIILVHDEDYKIIDSIKRIPPSVSRVRQILPGQIYEDPPSQHKLNPLDNISIDKFTEFINYKNIESFKAIYTSFVGISPIIAKEICFRASVDSKIMISELSKENIENLYTSFIDVFTNLKNNIYNPCLVINSKLDKVVDFSCINLSIFNDLHITRNESMSYILENYYNTKDIKERINQRASDLKKSISIKLDRLYNKLKKQEKELEESENAEIYKIKGELINTYVYMIEKGMDKVEVANYYDPDYSNITISLDKNITPSLNSQRYFKKYNKYKNAKKEVTSQMEITYEEIDYLENIILSIENCENLAELQDIKDELAKVGYVKVRGKDKDKIKKDKNKLTTTPHEFLSSDGFTVFVGKNNKQNDHLTLRVANADDIWMHTKNIPGSHVIIKTENKDVPDNTILEAAMLAAFFSKAKMSAQVPVDYTKKKNIKKPNGAKPGMVIYETNSTVYVTPSEELVVKLKKN